MLRSRIRICLGLTVVFFLAVAGGTMAVGGENPFGTEVLRFGYSSNLFSEVSRSDAKAALAIWTQELVQLAGYRLKTEMVLFEDLPTLVAAIRDDKIDFVGLSSLDYLRIRNRTSMEPALTGRKGGRVGEEQVLLVHRDSGITSLGHLKGRKLTRMGGSSGEIASLWIDTVLAKKGFPMAGRHFAGVKEVGKAQAAILPVFFRKADACVVNRRAWEIAVELNPQVGRELVVLANSPEFPIAVTCFRSSMSEEQKIEFIRLSLKMVSTPAGKQILTLFKIDTISRAGSINMESLATLLADHDRYAAVARRR